MILFCGFNVEDFFMIGFGGWLVMHALCFLELSVLEMRL